MIDLYTSATPNGYKASIVLEGCGLDYPFTSVRLGQLQQQEDWFFAYEPEWAYSGYG